MPDIAQPTESSLAGRSVLVTGGAGFIGSHVVDRLLDAGCRVTVIDNFDPFYEPAVKEANLAPHLADRRFRLVRCDIRDRETLRRELGGEEYAAVVHLAAKAGVRPSIVDPVAYQEVNVQGTQNLLELARERGIGRFVFASSSSVYGVNPRLPWREDDFVLQPISPYAATKVAGELLGHVYHHLYGLRFVALRFFTVYGPRQRPDLAIHKFARLIRDGRSIPIYGDGTTRRDYTYVDDAVEAVLRALDYEGGGYEVINVGNHETVELRELVRMLAGELGREARCEFLPPQPGDVPATWADTAKAERLLGFRPRTPFREGLRRFVAWFQGRG
ncbi:MAG: GDP-mannose 4,6-dehydratase [Acidobacteriota bacterium]